MEKIKIIVDSTSDLPEEIVKENEIEVLPLEIRFGEETFRDRVDINLDSMLERIKNDPETFPKTACVSPGVIEESFEKWINEGYDIIFICMSSKMSATYNNALLMAEEHKDRIYCTDSGSVSCGVGLLALKAVKYIKEGKNAAEVHSFLEKDVFGLHIQFMVDTLEFLHRSGRCSAVTKLVGGFFSIHPALKMNKGSLTLTRIARGKMTKVADTILTDFKKDIDLVDKDAIILGDTGVEPSLIETIKNKINEITKGLIPLLIWKGGCVITSHVGPGTLALFYIKRPKTKK